jgi:hypothetical protein
MPEEAPVTSAQGPYFPRSRLFSAFERFIGSSIEVGQKQFRKVLPCRCPYAKAKVNRQGRLKR